MPGLSVTPSPPT